MGNNIEVNYLEKSVIICLAIICVHSPSDIRGYLLQAFAEECLCPMTICTMYEQSITGELNDSPALESL